MLEHFEDVLAKSLRKRGKGVWLRDSFGEAMLGVNLAVKGVVKLRSDMFSM